jgi:hypothetical protein
LYKFPNFQHGSIPPILEFATVLNASTAHEGTPFSDFTKLESMTLI